ncbi:bifunctional DNA primase/polymerase [Streptomyces sp. MAA16]|uniref:bifunctional DNA primase/polymerase n=1 Tax=Streptomyces sp. MAA16 TaxID=3035116 RepID=UPI002473117E|nr:bifunctional DNA primase/polymerase [Streptomyces sp. MAA16]
MATDRQATRPALAHALSAADRGLAVIPLSRTKLPALRSPHREETGDGGGGEGGDRGRDEGGGGRRGEGGGGRRGESGGQGRGEGGGRGEGVARPARPCHGECGRPGHGVYDASTDPARIRALFAAAPWATGYGIACGLPPHHLIGVDLDTKPGTDASANLRALARRHLFTIPETVVVLTPSGGRHLWLTGPADAVVPNSAGRLAPGIDIRGAGGYLVGPGSRTDHGVYSTAPGTDRLAPAPCPVPLLRLLLPPPRPLHPRSAPADGGYHGQGLVQFVRSARPGQRNTRLFWAACRAYENGIGPSLTGPLLDAARATGLTEREARGTIASAARMTGHRG